MSLCQILTNPTEFIFCEFKKSFVFFFFFFKCFINENADDIILKCFPGSALNDGQWHSVELNSRRGRLTIAVDKEEGSHVSSSVTAGSQLFFGGESEITFFFLLLNINNSKAILPFLTQTFNGKLYL